MLMASEAQRGDPPRFSVVAFWAQAEGGYTCLLCDGWACVWGGYMHMDLDFTLSEGV